MFAFKKLNESHLELVLDWRTQPEVTDFMFSDIDKDIEKHRQWFAALNNDTSCHYWVIYHLDKPIGVINQSEISEPHQRCSWGYYIGELEHRNLGGLIPPYFYNYLFNQTNIKKLCAEVMDINPQVIKLHTLHGYREVGVLKSHICKHGHWHDVYLLELHKDNWLNKKRFKGYSAYFE